MGDAKRCCCVFVWQVLIPVGLPTLKITCMLDGSYCW
jgi:hypothetical protein